MPRRSRTEVSRSLCNCAPIDLHRIRTSGVEAAARAAVAHLTRDRGPDRGFWMHVDADVLDDAIMPAVDYRLPDGLSWDELTTAMRIAIESHRVVGLELTIYNPKLDPDGAGARGLYYFVTSQVI